MFVCRGVVWVAPLFCGFEMKMKRERNKREMQISFFTKQTNSPETRVFIGRKKREPTGTELQ